jgi:hypothetical protein
VTFVLCDAAHEADEPLLFESPDREQAVPGADVLVETDDQGFGRGQLAIGSGGHAVASPCGAKRNGADVRV